MGIPSAGAVIHICIQCGLEENQSSLMAHRQLHDNSEKLMEVFQDLELPATWALSHRHIELAKTVARLDRLRNELALLTDQSWCMPTSSRESFLTELRSRLDLYRSLPVDVSTLVLHDNSAERNLNGLACEGIQVVRRQAVDPVGRKTRPNTVPRYGLLVVEPTAVLPGRPGFWVRWDTAYSAKRCLWHAMSWRTSQAVAIDLGQLIQLPESRMRQLVSWLRTVARLKDAGRLEIEPLRSVVARRCPSHAETASQSILKRAA